MTEAINGSLLFWAIITIGGLACLSQSPGALEHIGRKLRARSRGLIASRSAFHTEYQRSLDEDARSEEGRKLLAELRVERVEE